MKSMWSTLWGARALLTLKRKAVNVRRLDSIFDSADHVPHGGGSLKLTCTTKRRAFAPVSTIGRVLIGRLEAIESQCSLSRATRRVRYSGPTVGFLERSQGKYIGPPSGPIVYVAGALNQ